jgi:hypothetical protein
MIGKHAPCSRCGTEYSTRRLRCPNCLLPREGPAASLAARDRLAGFVLLTVGALGALATCWWLYKSGLGRHGIVLIVPVWLLLHGMLLLTGIHLRDFYVWWNQLRPPGRIAIQALGFLVFALLVWLALTLGGW